MQKWHQQLLATKGLFLYDELLVIVSKLIRNNC
jgi:hypothetical protein